MKEGIGGTFMIYVLLVFLAVYITFIAVAFNYARAFKVKNKVIDIIEQNEGMEEADFNNVSATNTSGVTGKINEYLNAISYNVVLSNDDKTNRGVCFEKGICIDEYIGTSIHGMQNTYYKVTTFVTIEFPFMNLGITIPVKGETRKIERIRT